VAKSLVLSVLTPAGPLASDRRIGWLQARLADGGSIGIWPGHAPLLAETVSGTVRFLDGSRERSLDLQAGILHIDASGATILTPGEVSASGPPKAADLAPESQMSEAEDVSGG
jgi:F0F1-type ATP synthase epsilon subunit